MDNFVSASYDIAFKALFVRNKDLLRPVFERNDRRSAYG